MCLPPRSSTLFPYTTLFRSFAAITASVASSPTFLRIASGPRDPQKSRRGRSEEHTSELQSLRHLVCRLLLEKKTTNQCVSETTIMQMSNLLLHETLRDQQTW